MTRDELINYLRDNFEADEEINFVYYDDGDDVRTTKCTVETHYSHKINGHYQWLEFVKDENGNLVKKYIKLTNEQAKEINTTRQWNGDYLSRDEISNRMLWVTENITNDNKKCLFIDY
jgi:hypothetical protein